MSSFFSISATRFGVWTMVRGFAGRRRATCWMHSTRAFSHLRHVLGRDRKCNRDMILTSGRCWPSQRARSGPCACGSARRQRRFLFFPLWPPWWQRLARRAESRSTMPRSGGEVRSCCQEPGEAAGEWEQRNERTEQEHLTVDQTPVRCRREIRTSREQESPPPESHVAGIDDTSVELCSVVGSLFPFGRVLPRRPTIPDVAVCHCVLCVIWLFPGLSTARYSYTVVAKPAARTQ